MRRALIPRVGSIIVALLILPLAIPADLSAQETQTREDAPPASQVGDTTAGEPPELSVSEVMWRAAIRALEERGMTIHTASEDARQIVTEFTSLDPNAISSFVVLQEQDQEVKWARAEYRLSIAIAPRSNDAQPNQKKDGMRVLIKAEIGAWEQGPRLEARRALQSNNALEKEFLQGFLNAVPRVETSPTPTRVEVDRDRGFSRGPKDAPVAIVQFSDYQCPYCRTVLGTLNEVMTRFPGKVKWVFRDFPIQSIHPTAEKAHEAARCAAVEGKFWEYHDLLFERSPRHSLEELKQYAQELKLAPEAFADCLDLGKYKTEVARDVQDGIRLGVSGTPTFYINGWVLTGNQPFTVFEKLIERELESNARR